MAASSSGPKPVNVEVAPRNETFKRITRNAQHTQIQDAPARFPVQPQTIMTIDKQSSSKYVINRGGETTPPSAATVPQKPPLQVYLKNNEINFNLPAKWKRLLVKGEVVYVSPSGTTLRNLLQIKKYLLSAGTCKCGLPCPFKPEALFDFNPKAPAVQLPVNEDSLKYCSHQIRTGKTVSPQNHIELDEKSRIIDPNSVMNHNNNNNNNNSRTKQHEPNLYLTSNGKERLLAPAPQTNPVVTNKNNRPTFKEDPTGYLNQQTELLHNSISNLHSPNNAPTQSVSSSAPPKVNHDGDSSSSSSSSSSSLFDSRFSSVVGSTPGVAAASMMMASSDTQRQMGKGHIADTGKRKHHVTSYHVPSPSPSQSPVSSSTLTQRSTPDTGRASTDSIGSSLHSPGEVTTVPQQQLTSIAPAPMMKQVITRQRRVVNTGHGLQQFVEDEPERLVITSNSQVVTVPKFGKTITTNNIQSHHPQFVQHRDGSGMMINSDGQTTTFNTVSRPNVMIQTSTGQMVHSTPSIITASSDPHQHHHNMFTSAANNLQPIILSNSGNIIQSQQLLSPTGGATIVSQGPRLITANNQMHIINQTSHPTTVLSSSNEQQLLSPSATGQTVILNTMPNSVIIQQQPNHLLNGQIINSVPQDASNGSASTGPIKKKLKKRRGELSGPTTIGNQLIAQQTSQSAPSPGNSFSIQTQESQQPQIVQMTSPLSSPSFQLSPGLPSLAIVPKAQQTQQIILPNGQTLLQPVNLISQPVSLVSPGLMMTNDPGSATLVQLPNVTHITPQGMVIRTQCPQQKQFLSPPATNQYIVNQNGQMSQIYTTNMVQGPSIIHHHQQTQPTIINSQTQQLFASNATGIVTTQQPQGLINVIGSDGSTGMTLHHKGNGRAPSQNSLPPPDTTTHSPLSPDRPASNRSGASYDGMAMVQCVSSSQPDSGSPSSIDPQHFQPHLTTLEYTDQGKTLITEKRGQRS